MVLWYFVLQFDLIFCVHGFVKLDIDYTRESMHVKLQNVRMQELT